MFQRLEIFDMAQGLLRHATARQSVIAGNIANADTPGYRARDVAPFAETYRGAGEAGLRTTRAQHIRPQARGGELPIVAASGTTVAPNGNDVSLESEMVKAAEVRIQYDMAMSVYTSALDILKASIGRGR